MFIITCDEEQKLFNIKEYFKNFITRDLGSLKDFLGIEVAHNNEDISLSQCKYVLDFLQETSTLGTRSTSVPMNSKLHPHDDSKKVDNQSY